MRAAASGPRAGEFTPLFLRSGLYAAGYHQEAGFDRGFGFIDGERATCSSTAPRLREAPFESLPIGQTVQYEVGQGPKGSSRRERLWPLGH